jgi:alkyl sulfatase BDS1-like metallo-beta-lactamase superfamily hydrolase
MTKPNYQEMTQQELREYILNHRDDEDAVSEAVVRVQNNGVTLNSIDELRQFVERKRRQNLEPS